VPAWPGFLAWASALARSRCSFIRRRKPSSSTDRPCSAAISRVRSIGKPQVSWSRKALSPAGAWAPGALVSVTAASRMVGPGLGLGDGGVEEGGAGLERLEEGVLLGEGDLLDALAVGDELRVLLAHHLDDRVDQVLDDRAGGTEQTHVADGAAHDAAQHVTAA